MEKKSHLVDKVTYFKYLCYLQKKKNPANTTTKVKVKSNVEILWILSFASAIFNPYTKDPLTLPFWPWRTNKNKHMNCQSEAIDWYIRPWLKLNW